MASPPCSCVCLPAAAAVAAPNTAAGCSAAPLSCAVSLIALARCAIDGSYKAQRPPTPPDFIPDYENLQKLLAGLRVAVLRVPGQQGGGEGVSNTAGSHDSH